MNFLTKGTGSPTEFVGLKEILMDDLRIFLGNNLFRGLFPLANLLNGTPFEGTRSVGKGVVRSVAGTK